MVPRRLILFALTAFLVGSCATFPEPDGEYATTWSAADNAQLLALIHGRCDIERTIRDIEVIRPGRARVVTTKGNGSGAFTGTEFTIEKKRGRWFIVGPVRPTTYVVGS
jgi:hypothetical protein